MPNIKFALVVLYTEAVLTTEAVKPLRVVLPEVSLATMVEAPFAEDAVVAELGIDVNSAPEPVYTVAVNPLKTALPAASLATMVEAPLADAAVVLALATVPVLMLVPFSVDMLTPGPLNPDPPDVIAPAAKLPEASLATMVETVFAFVAVVALLGIDVNNAPEPVKNAAVNPLKTALPAASLATMVLAPLADAAEVALFGIEAAVNPEPEPVNDCAVIAPALNAPEASLATMVETVFAFVAVVLTLATVPVFMLLPLSVDMLTPGPLNPEPPDVIAPAAKLPEASLVTIAETVLAESAVVLALATVPVVTLVPLSAVNNAPLPETAPVNIFAVKPLKAALPAASLATMVLAPLADAAVVAELGIDVSPAPEPVNNIEVIASTRIEAASWNAIVPKN
jgi:hypothetical protein